MNRHVSRVLDFIYPAYCQLCSAQLSHGRCICEDCQEKLTPVQAPFCSCCGECFDGHINDTFTCSNCSGLELFFSFARAAYQADTHSLQLVHDFKYNRQIHLAAELARLTSHALEDPRFDPYLKDGILVPVPLHGKRLRKRRFNQAEEIAKHLSRDQDIPWANILIRNRHTDTQTRFGRKKRLENLRGAFQVKGKLAAKLTGKHIILLDDVLTTGSTAHECAQTLLINGARKVAVLTLLRG